MFVFRVNFLYHVLFRAEFEEVDFDVWFFKMCVIFREKIFVFSVCNNSPIFAVFVAAYALLRYESSLQLGFQHNSIQNAMSSTPRFRLAASDW